MRLYDLDPKVNQPQESKQTVEPVGLYFFDVENITESEARELFGLRKDPNGKYFLARYNTNEHVFERKYQQAEQLWGQPSQVVITEHFKLDKPDLHSPVVRGLSVLKMDQFYDLYRYSMALAAADARGIQFAPESLYGDMPAMIAYSSQEIDMIKTASKAVGQEAEIIRDVGDPEHVTRNTESPIGSQEMSQDEKKGGDVAWFKKESSSSAVPSHEWISRPTSGRKKGAEKIKPGTTIKSKEAKLEKASEYHFPE